MYAKIKKSDDSLQALQRDINQLGVIHFVKSKKHKFKVAKSKANQQNASSLQYNYEPRLPSLYEKPDGSAIKKKLTNLHNNQHNSLIQRIRQFENRINNLETENAVHKRQNERLIQHVAILKHQKIIGNQGKRNKQATPVIIHSIPQNIPQPYIFSPIMSPMMGYPGMPGMLGMPGMQGMQGMQGMPGMQGISAMNPYQMGFNPSQQNEGINKSEKKSKAQKKWAKYSPISRFRIIGYVIFFSIFFPKYAKSFTLHRFDRFKSLWGKQQSIIDARQKLSAYFRSNISLDIFQIQEINELDSLQDLEEEGPQAKSEKKKSSKQSKGEKIENESQSQSDDSSEIQSSMEQKMNKLNNQNAQSEENVFQFYLKIDIAVSFVCQFIKRICSSVSQNQFEEKNSYLSLFLARQFQPDRLHDQIDVKNLNLHVQKGYSQNEATVTQYLFIKNIFLYVFVEQSMLSQFGKRFYIDSQKRSNKSLQNKVFFSFFIRTSIFKIMLENYLNNKMKQAKEFPLPKEELLPFYKQFERENPLKNNISFENNGIDMKQDNVHQISMQQIQKRQEQIKNMLDSCCQVLMKKFMAYRKKNEYEIIKTKTLKQKYRTDQNSYFQLHKKQEIAKQINRKKQNLKRSKSSMVTSKYSSVDSDKISIVKRLPGGMKTKKAF